MLQVLQYLELHWQRHYQRFVLVVGGWEHEWFIIEEVLMGSATLAHPHKANIVVFVRIGTGPKQEDDKQWVVAPICAAL